MGTVGFETRETSSDSDYLRRLGIDCAALIAGSPESWAEASRWLEELPICRAVSERGRPADNEERTCLIVDLDRLAVKAGDEAGDVFCLYDNEAEAKRVQGPVLRRIRNAWQAASYRFLHQLRGDDRYYDFGMADARRITLLAALTFNRDFDGSPVGLSFPWEPPAECEATFEARADAWLYLTSELFAESQLIELTETAIDYLRRSGHSAAGGCDVAADTIEESSAGEQAGPRTPAIAASDDVPPALTPNQREVLKTMHLFDPSVLLTAKMIRDEMNPVTRLSQETIRQCVTYLIKVDLTERPEGPRSGARLTREGRQRAGKIAD